MKKKEIKKQINPKFDIRKKSKAKSKTKKLNNRETSKEHNNPKVGINISKMSPNKNKYNIHNMNMINTSNKQNLWDNQIKNIESSEDYKNNKNQLIHGVNNIINEGQKIKNNKIIDNQNSLPKLKDLFSFPPKVGLYNISSIPYLNAVLQCFCQIEEFVSFLKYDKYVNEVIDNYSKNNKNCLTSLFKILVDNIWPDDTQKFKLTNKPFSPIEIKKLIEVINPIFKNRGPKDAKDLINLIIMTLHEELKETKVGNSVQITNNLNKDIIYII